MHFSATLFCVGNKQAADAATSIVVVIAVAVTFDVVAVTAVIVFWF